MDFDDEKELFFPKIIKKTPQEENRERAIEKIKIQDEQARVGALNLLKANPPQKQETHPKEEPQTDGELEDYASIIATQFKPSQEVNDRVLEIRRNDPIRFKKLEALIIEKMNKRR